MTRIYDTVSTKVLKGILADTPSFQIAAANGSAKLTTLYAINLKLVAK